jgi:hypothetical protein
MKHLIPNDPAASDTVTEGAMHWLPHDAYAITFRNKLEYSSRVGEVGKNVRPILGMTQTYYTPTDGQSQSPRHSTQPSQEEINQACALIIEVKRRVCAAEIQAAVQTEQERHAAEIQSVLETERKAGEERLAVLLVNHEAKLLSHLRYNTSTAASSQDTLPPVTHYKNRWSLTRVYSTRYCRHASNLTRVTSNTCQIVQA